MLGMACSSRQLWLFGGTTDYNKNLGVSTAFVYKNGQFYFDHYSAPYTVTTYAYFVPNPAATPAYYLRLDQTIANIDGSEAQPFTLDLSVAAEAAYGTLRQSPSTCTGSLSSPCTPSGTATLVVGLYSTSQAIDGIAVGTYPATYWSSDPGRVLVSSSFGVSNNVLHLQQTQWQVAPQTARTLSMYVMVGSFATALGYAQQRCSFAITVPNPTTNGAITPVPANGATYQVGVTVSGVGSCPWEASSDSPILVINRGTTGTGSGSVDITVTTNTTSAVRVANLYVGGQIIPVFQNPTPANVPGTPTALFATATSVTAVGLTWQGVTGADHYQINRKSGGGYTPIGTSATTAFTDTTVSVNTSYVYTLSAIDANGNASLPSLPDLATTTLFTDDPLMAGTTLVKAQHLVDLRTAVNAVRAAAGLAPASFTNVNLSGATIKAIDVQELRDALDPARQTLGLSAVSYSDALLVAGTIVKAAHVQQLRAGTK